MRVDHGVPYKCLPARENFSGFVLITIVRDRTIDGHQISVYFPLSKRVAGQSWRLSAWVSHVEVHGSYVSMTIP